MCNCIKEKEQLVLENAKDKLSALENWEIETVEFKHTTELLFSRLNIPIVIKGHNSEGKLSKKEIYFKRELYFPIIYCPFCGEKIN